jgi:hypothetical protein
MTIITGKNHLFFVTSPRTPFKMIDEIALLVKNYQGQKWSTSQVKFANDLNQSSFFQGSAAKDQGFSARDRINRAPKALGFVDLSPTIQLTPAGDAFINGKRPHEAFTRQLMKFQLPSPFHIDTSGGYFIKPYLELLRMVYVLDGLSKDEIALFFTELNHVQKFDSVKQKIIDFRNQRKALNRSKTSYAQLLSTTFENQILHIYSNEIKTGNINTRETTTKTVKEFVKKKRSNHTDYADAAIRYMRSTLLCTLQRHTYKLVIAPDKIQEVEFLLKSVSRKPIYTDKQDEKRYKQYLFDSTTPALFTDNIERLEKEVTNLLTQVKIDQALENLAQTALKSRDIEALKDIKEAIGTAKLDKVVSEQVSKLKTYKEHDDIQLVFDQIKANDVVDRPLFMEWNVWRGMTMLNDGDIRGNFKMDDNGMPLSTASGNMADIDCEYADFNMTVEVTLSMGQKQYEMEGEPVTRHLSHSKKKSNKETYCLFIAGSLNDATLAYFYSLHKIPIQYYGGISKIVPLGLEDFRDMLRTAHASNVKPTSENLHDFMEYLSQMALTTTDEKEWYKEIKEHCKKWTTNFKVV